jgi:hypothetical protein
LNEFFSTDPVVAMDSYCCVGGLISTIYGAKYLNQSYSALVEKKALHKEQFSNYCTAASIEDSKEIIAFIFLNIFKKYVF